MELGCNTVNFRKMDLDYALEKIAEAGYEYVEVEANLKWCSHADPWKDDPVKFKDKVKSFGFKGVSAIGSHRELITSEQGVKDIKRALEWAHDAGVPVILTGEGRIPEGMSVENAISILKPRYEEILEVAEKNKVFLAIEDHGSISLTPDGLPGLLRLVKSEWFGVNFDTANIHRGDYVGTDSKGYEWKMGTKSRYDEVELLKKVADKVKHVHIKDVVGRKAVTLGKGEINLKGCLKVLKDTNYSGVLSYETEGFEDPEEAFKMILDSKEFLINALRNL
ncbi:MAG: sugar phosphate isomerase/epimerase [Actinobacteria bacterium]|nr:sugar phosphate isomerase/epimerase [Actinomycetota bacterium]